MKFATNDQTCRDYLLFAVALIWSWLQPRFGWFEKCCHGEHSLPIQVRPLWLQMYNVSDTRNV